MLLILEAANLFVLPNMSEHLALHSVRLPEHEEICVPHLPGGAYRAIEVPMQLERMECQFELIGWQPYILRLMTQDAQHRDGRTFMIYGLLRNPMVPEAPMRVQAQIEGRIGRVENTEFVRGALNEHRYEIRFITHYELSIDDQMVQRWDFYNNTLEADGIEQQVPLK